MYYNEFDPYASQWLKKLVAEGHIGHGEVDSRSICDLTPDDVPLGVQAHFFAGIGIWSLALRMAGVPDDFPVFTGSCPCQPFSNAGKRKGVKDERHLWPVWREIIREHRPPAIFGEQVASADGRAWLSDVRRDLEEMGYAVGAADLCGACVGAPHIRQRLYFGAARLGDSNHPRLQRHPKLDGPGGKSESSGHHRETGGNGGLGNSDHKRRDGEYSLLREGQNTAAQTAWSGKSQRPRDAWGITHPSLPILVERDMGVAFYRSRGVEGGADWLLCREPSGVPSWRPIERGTLPLGYGDSRTMGRLRAYGNAIIPQVAATFIQAFLESLGDLDR